MTIDRSKHLLTLLDWDAIRIQNTLELAIEFKKNRHLHPAHLTGESVAMYFEKPSLRTITTFQVGIHQLGGQPILLSPDSIGLGKRESIEDISRCLGRWVKGLVVRCFSQKLLEKLAEHSGVPVINALSDDYHPCQALALGQALLENFGKLQGLNVVFVGDGNNVATEIAVMCAKLGMNFTLACPVAYNFKSSVWEELSPLFTQSTLKVLHSAVETVADAHLVYTDVWASMGQEAETQKRKLDFAEFQVNEALLAKAPKGCFISHCLPAHRGDEITDGIMDGPNQLCFDEAENRLHVQKAVMFDLLNR